MKKQIVFIHGGQVYEKYDAYIEDLKRFTVEPQSEKKRWRQSLQTELEEDYEVYMPEMPNKFNAHYLEWRIWFEKFFPFLTNEVILIGHSLGGLFLIKYLSENSLPITVSSLYLVAAPYYAIDSIEGGDFRFDAQLLSMLEQKSDTVTFLHSKDDEVVPFSHFETFKKMIPGAKYVEFTDKGHFTQETFPEFVEMIRGR